MKHEKKIRLVITRGLNAAAENDPETQLALADAVKRFLACDWGELEEEDIEANNADLQSRDGHILAKYNTPAGDIFINLEFSGEEEPEDIACLMFPEEY